MIFHGSMCLEVQLEIHGVTFCILGDLFEVVLTTKT